MSNYSNQQENQKGRSLLEVIMVIILMIILTIGGLWMYRRALNTHEANTIYEDILVQGEALRNRGTATNKSIYDSSIGHYTRTGARMIFCPDSSTCPVQGAETFEIKVLELEADVCRMLKKKNWPSDKVNYIECSIRNQSDLSVVFFSNFKE